MGLVAGGRAGLADFVDELDAHHPLVVGKVDLAGKVVQVADEGGHDLPRARRGLGADGVNDALREVGVVSSHCDRRTSGTRGSRCKGSDVTEEKIGVRSMSPVSLPSCALERQVYILSRRST